MQSSYLGPDVLKGEIWTHGSLQRMAKENIPWPESKNISTSYSNDSELSLAERALKWQTRMFYG